MGLQAFKVPGIPASQDLQNVSQLLGSARRARINLIRSGRSHAADSSRYTLGAGPSAIGAGVASTMQSPSHALHSTGLTEAAFQRRKIDELEEENMRLKEQNKALKAKFERIAAALALGPKL